MYYKHLIIRIFFLMMFFLSGCSLLDEKYDNVTLDKERFSEMAKLESIHIGMTRKQVEYIIGKSLISDSFNDAYHYIFYDKDSGKNKTLSIFFKKNRVFYMNLY